MTTIHQGPEVAVPSVVNEEHEAIRASWELPAYDRGEARAARSTRPLVVGVLASALGLAVGFGAGYWAHDQMVADVAPIVVSQVKGPVDANGMTLGRRVAPIERALPSGMTQPGPLDANGAPLGGRVPPL